jgi:carbonic anhydrase
MHPVDPDTALARLLEGNRRFAAGHPEAAAASADRIALADAQQPFAAILGCSDSRVPVETVFDQGPGELFVIRLAGNIVTAEGLGSIEYAVEVLGSSLVVVLGHSRCGAVRAAMSFVESGTELPGHIQLLAAAIAPVAADTRATGDDWWPAAVACNTRAACLALLRRSPLLRVAATRGKLRVAAMLYDLQSGVVELLD